MRAATRDFRRNLHQLHHGTRRCASERRRALGGVAVQREDRVRVHARHTFQP
jgi:hypothetical protein